MKFPTLMYRVPGPFRRPGGLTFNTIGASDAEEFARLLGNGWHPSLDAALGLEDHDMPPTREEMEAKAKQLGISFNKRTNDKTLLRRIEEAL